jgi:hypothetical protein
LKTVAILQSNYVPWKGYFDIIAAVVEFIIHDDVQYTKQDWRNRNQIKTPQGLKDYIDESVFEDVGIKLTWFNYSGYPQYPQLWGEFIHGVTILGLLFNCGKDAPKYMKHIKS